MTDPAVKRARIRALITGISLSVGLIGFVYGNIQKEEAMATAEKLTECERRSATMQEMARQQMLDAQRAALQMQNELERLRSSNK